MTAAPSMSALANDSNAAVIGSTALLACAFPGTFDPVVESARAGPGNYAGDAPMEYRIRCRCCGAYGPKDTSPERAASGWNMLGRMMPSYRRANTKLGN